MAWKQIAISGSSLALSGLGVQTDSNSLGIISASGKVFATTVDGASSGEIDQIVISTATTGEFKFVARNQIQNLLGNSLIPGTNVTGTSYNGNATRTFLVDREGLSGNGFTTFSDATIRIGQGNNILTGSGNINVNSSTLADSARGLEYDAGGEDIGLKFDSTLRVAGGTPALIKKGPTEGGGAVVGAALTGGDGLNFRGGASYNFSAARVMIVDSGSIVGGGLGATTSGTIAIREKAGNILVNNTAVIFDGDEFRVANFLVDDGGNTITLGLTSGDSTTVLIPGSGSFIGSASFAHTSDFEVADQFIVVNSSSAASDANAFGFALQTGSSNTIVMAKSGSAGGASADRNWGVFQGNAAGSTLENKIGNVRLHLQTQLGASPNSNEGQTIVAGDDISIKGNTLVSDISSTKAFWFYTG